MALTKPQNGDRLADPEETMRRYKASGDVDLRNQLVLHYASNVSAAIHNMRSILLSRVSYEEFFDQGIVCLIECLERYDPARGATFETYSYKAVRGALLNYMRRQSWLPNRVREARRDIAAAQDTLRQSLLREPTDRELAAALEVDETELGRNLTEIAAADAVSLEDLLDQTGKNALTRSRDPGGGIEENMLRQELLQTLGAAIEALPPRQRQVVTLCYYENLNLREIGEVLDLTQQRVSQIRSAAIASLAGTLNAYLNA